MASGFIHDVHSLVVYGRSYSAIHRRKDAASARTPGLRHRRVRHGWYRAYGRHWDFDEPFPASISSRVGRILDRAGATKAEEYQASLSHDFLDKTWDFADQARRERTRTRNYWGGFFVWLILNPDLLESWAGVDVQHGRIHRVIAGNDVWEEAPEVTAEYGRLLGQAQFLLRVDRELRSTLEILGGRPDRMPAA